MGEIIALIEDESKGQIEGRHAKQFRVFLFWYDNQ